MGGGSPKKPSVSLVEGVFGLPPSARMVKPTRRHLGSIPGPMALRISRKVLRGETRLSASQAVPPRG